MSVEAPVVETPIFELPTTIQTIRFDRHEITQAELRLRQLAVMAMSPEDLVQYRDLLERETYWQQPQESRELYHVYDRLDYLKFSNLLTPDDVDNAIQERRNIQVAVNMGKTRAWNQFIRNPKTESMYPTMSDEERSFWDKSYTVEMQALHARKAALSDQKIVKTIHQYPKTTRLAETGYKPGDVIMRHLTIRTLSEKQLDRAYDLLNQDTTWDSPVKDSLLLHMEERAYELTYLYLHTVPEVVFVYWERWHNHTMVKEGNAAAWTDILPSDEPPHMYAAMSREEKRLWNAAYETERQALVMRLNDIVSDPDHQDGPVNTVVRYAIADTRHEGGKVSDSILNPVLPDQRDVEFRQKLADVNLLNTNLETAHAMRMLTDVFRDDSLAMVVNRLLFRDHSSHIHPLGRLFIGYHPVMEDILKNPNVEGMTIYGKHSYAIFYAENNKYFMIKHRYIDGKERITKHMEFTPADLTRHITFKNVRKIMFGPLNNGNPSWDEINRLNREHAIELVPVHEKNDTGRSLAYSSLVSE